MRRSAWLAPLVLASTLLIAPATASADARGEPAPDAVVLAAEDAVVLAAEADTAELGPDPQPREAEDNPARTLAGYEDPGVQFTWAASFLLLGGAITGLIVGGALWYLLVVRPGKQPDAS